MKEKMDAVGLALKPMVGAEYAKYYADLQAQAKEVHGVGAQDAVGRLHRRPARR
jgi:hypothetical protein